MATFPGVSLVRKSERMTSPDISNETEGRIIEALVHDKSRLMEVYVGTIQPGGISDKQPFVHEGEEFCYIINGSLEFTVGGEKYDVNEGDLIYFISSLPHSYKNRGSKITTCLWGEAGSSKS